MKIVSENNLMDFEERNSKRIEKISKELFSAVLDEFNDYTDIKESYRMKQLYLNHIMDCIVESLGSEFAFNVEKYYKEKENK